MHQNHRLERNTGKMRCASLKQHKNLRDPLMYEKNAITVLQSIVACLSMIGAD